MSHGSRRRKQFAMGHRHLAKICGKSYKGGRPIYAGKSSLSVSAAIARERDFARRQAAMKQKKK
jgi:hypothetical protein